MGELWVDTPYSEEISAHVEKWIGPVDYVIHEILSDVVHIDVLVVRPGGNRKCYTLITSGMSAKAMNVPQDAANWARSELIISLPPNNPYLANAGPEAHHDENEDEGFDEPDPPGYYPVAHLTRYARYPHLADTWIGPGHTLVSANPPEPLGDDTSMTGYLVDLPYAIGLIEGFNFTAKDGVRVNLLQMYPIHTDELEFKLQNGGDALMNKLTASDALECFDPLRKSVIKKKFFGLF